MYTNVAILQASGLFLLESQKDDYSTKRDKLLSKGCTETYLNHITGDDGKSVIGKLMMYVLDAFRLTATDVNGKFKVLHVGSYKECNAKKIEMFHNE